MTDARLTAAFRDLRSQGLFARRNFVNTMVRHGLGVKWDGSPRTRIEVIVREEVTQ